MYNIIIKRVFIKYALFNFHTTIEIELLSERILIVKFLKQIKYFKCD